MQGLSALQMAPAFSAPTAAGAASPPDALQRRLSALEQLSRDIEWDVLELLPLPRDPSGSLDLSRRCSLDRTRQPSLQLSLVPGEDATIDVQVVHHFKVKAGLLDPAQLSAAAQGGMAQLLPTAAPLSALPSAAHAAATSLHLDRLPSDGVSCDLAAQLEQAVQLTPARTLARHRCSSSASSVGELVGLESLSSLSSLGAGSPLAYRPCPVRSPVVGMHHSGSGSAGTPSGGDAWAMHSHTQSTVEGTFPASSPPAAGFSVQHVANSPAQGLSGCGSPAADAGAAPALQPSSTFHVDSRDVLVGPRIAIGGFAEVFAGRYQVGWHSSSCRC
jgi:hypothetical protein